MIHLEKFDSKNLNVLSIIIKEAFDDDSMMHINKPGGPEGYDDGSFLKKWFCHEKANAFEIYNDSELIGGANIWINEKKKCNTLGCLFLNPKYKNLGYGTTTWKLIEAKFPLAEKWIVDTPGFSKRNRHFYTEKCGFNLVRIENADDFEESMCVFEKV